MTAVALAWRSRSNSLATATAFRDRTTAARERSLRSSGAGPLVLSVEAMNFTRVLVSFLLLFGADCSDVGIALGGMENPSPARMRRLVFPYRRGLGVFPSSFEGTQGVERVFQ